LTALILVFSGAAGSFVATLVAGHHNHSLVLVAFFYIWVLSPFIGMIVAFLISRRWPPAVRVRLCWLICLLAAASTLGYFLLPGIFGTRPAFVFLVIPLLNWVLLGVMYFSFSKTENNGDLKNQIG